MCRVPGLDEGRDKLKVVLENCLAGLPVYLVSMVCRCDPVVEWLLQQGTVAWARPLLEGCASDEHRRFHYIALYRQAALRFHLGWGL